MQTRRQDPSSKRFCQEAFASSAEYDRGILANLVAARCHKINDPEEVAMLWSLQQVSWREGSLEKFASDFLAVNQALIGTPSMLKFGTGPNRVYNAEQVRAIRAELPDSLQSGFVLRGEVAARDEAAFYIPGSPAPRTDLHPNSYSAAEFVQACVITVSGFADMIRAALVDPASPSLKCGLWNFPSLWVALCKWRQSEILAAQNRIVETEVTRLVFDELDFALEARGFVLLEGREGIGKTEAVRSWCERHPGRVLYVRLESSADEASFYRTIARALGTASASTRKAQEMRVRVEDALQAGHLMLVLDEAHFLWPQAGRSERGAPRRIDWLRTSLVDFGVSVALISTPQFFEKQCDRFRKAGWNANQIQRRLTRTACLPEVLSASDAVAVAQKHFPNVSASMSKKIAGVSLLSIGYLTSMMHLRKRVDFFATRRPGTPELVLVEQALAEMAEREGINMSAAPTKSSPAAPAQNPRITTGAALPLPVPVRAGRLTFSPQHDPALA